jgi:cold shock CspA family protein
MAITGNMTFYDEPSAWGVILGDDGRIYIVRGGHMVAPSPRAGDKVAFEPRKTSSGLRAVDVRKTP